jgi:hypothetical protein
MTIQLDTTIRFSTPEDEAWLADCWYKAQKDLYPNKFIFDFNNKYHRYIENLLAKSITTVVCLDDDPFYNVSQITYTSFHDDLVVHFAYTRLDQRGQGYLTSLINHINITNAPIIFTHPCKNENVMKHMCKKYIFDPSIIGLL